MPLFHYAPRDGNNLQDGLPDTHCKTKGRGEVGAHGEKTHPHETVALNIMDWKLFAQLAVTLLVAVLGGWVGHHFSMRRDLANERRKLRVTYLLEAYRRLEGASNRDDPGQYKADFESAIADIQLLGSPHQVALAREFAIEMARDRQSSLDRLIFDLRQSLRSELELDPVSEDVIYLRITTRLNPK